VEGGRSTCVGSAPQADRKADSSIAMEPRSRDAMNADAVMEMVIGVI